MQRSGLSVRARQLGAELRRSRAESGLPARRVALRAGISPSKLSRIEGGRRAPKVEDIAALLALYGVTGPARAELLELCREVEAGARGWWQRRELSLNQRTVIELESMATRIINFENVLIPGLLQTGEYTRNVLLDVAMLPEEKIQDRMVTRLARHAVLRKERPPQLIALIQEEALRQNIGGPAVMRRQLEYLLQVMNWCPDIAIHVVPSAAKPHPGLHGPMLKIDCGEDGSVVCLESHTSSLFFEDVQDVRFYAEALRRVSAVALDARESAALIAEVMHQHERNDEDAHAERGAQLDAEQLQRP